MNIDDSTIDHDIKEIYLKEYTKAVFNQITGEVRYIINKPEDFIKEDEMKL